MPMPFHIDSLWGATLLTLRACAMDWKRNGIMRVGKKSGIFVLSNALDICRVSFRRYLLLSLEVVKNPNTCIKSFGPNFFGRDLDFSRADC